MGCDINQQSPVSSEEGNSYLKIDLSKPEEIFDFSAPTSTLECRLTITIKPPPKLSELPVTYHTVHVIDDKDSNNNKKHFQCDQCNKMFFHAAHIRRNILTHTGEKSYCCRVCNERFLRNDCLLSHIWRHKRKNLCKCCVCKKEVLWLDWIRQTLTHDASEYENIAVQEVNTTQILFSWKKYFPDKQERSSNELQKEAKSPTLSSNNLFYQAVLCTHPTVGHYQQL